MKVSERRIAFILGQAEEGTSVEEENVRLRRLVANLSLDAPGGDPLKAIGLVWMAGIVR